MLGCACNFGYVIDDRMDDEMNDNEDVGQMIDFKCVKRTECFAEQQSTTERTNL